MGSQIANNNDRSRTYWTPTMERYFVDLMLEHMHKGNRTGHTFNKQAWNDMLTVFNANFASQYDKDALKSRYTNLWKQFNDVKNMLAQGGFSWDEDRNMVLADDYFWDTYLKVHPDARTYKTKSVQNFSDLCLIFGYTTADGRYSRSSHDIDIDDENGVNLGSPNPSNTENSRTEWTLAMDQYFTELLLNQKEKGNKLENSYTKESWTEMFNSFISKYGSHHTKRVLRHRYKKLHKYYSDILILLKQDGFSWDENEHMVVANDDIWDAYIKTHTQARFYRAKSMPNYKDLELIFGGVIIDETKRKELCNLDEDISGSKTGGERSRTYWTPPMDRYLIDLLLDHVNKGNRIGKTFVAQAWIEIVKSFNTNFNFKYEKDVLKNRYKHLKRQYNDVNTLLRETGFSWDDSREIVAADDHVWNAYIQDHPDARSYRVKTVPNYHKLCTIYCQSTSQGQYRHLAHNANSSLLCLEEKENKIWTDEMDDCFIELMLEQHTGNKVFNGFDDQIWTVITSSFNERCNLDYDNQALRDRYSYLLNQFNDVEFLLNQNGFHWDDSCQMVLANDETWEAYSKEHPYATSYKGTILRHRKELSMIFGGLFSEKLTIKPENIETVAIGGNPEILPKETETPNKKKRVKKLPLNSGRSSKVQKNKSDDIKEAFTDMANVVSKLVNGKRDKDYSAIEKAVEALQAIPDIDDELLLDGCDILEDEKKAKTFLALDNSIRKKWLLRKLGR